MRENSWDMTTIQVNIDYWVHAFGTKFIANNDQAKL